MENRRAENYRRNYHHHYQSSPYQRTSKNYGGFKSQQSRFEFQEKRPQFSVTHARVQATKSSIAGEVRTGITELRCNFIALELSDPNRRIFEYEVLFEPEVDDKRTKSWLVNQHLNSVAKNVIKVYNLGTLLWTPMETENEFSGAYELRNGQDIRVTMKKKCERKIPECKFLLNIIMKRIMSESKLVKINRSDFNPEMRHLIPEYKLEVWPGFVSNVQEFDGGILLNLDISHKVLQNKTVHNILSELLKTSSDARTFKEKAQQYLIGMSVLTTYNKKTVRIDDIDFDLNPLSTFERKGVKMTYVDYYKSQYNLDILDVQQPMLVYRKKQKLIGKETEETLLVFVPELCSPTGLSDEQKCNFKLMKQLATITQLTPEKRNKDITAFLRSINENADCRRLLSNWGLKIPENSIELCGRILNPETIRFGHNRTVEEPNADWGQALSRQQLLRPVPLEEWVIMYFYRDERVAQNFCRKAIEIGNRMGIRTSAPKFKIRINDERTETFCNQLRNNLNVQIVVLIMPTKKDDRYVAVKRVCHQIGLPSQVINAKTLLNLHRLDGVVTKIVMQMNCKLGGALWGISLPHEEEGMMLCGLESFHETGRLRPGASAVALVSSVNKDATRWTSNSVLMSAGQTIFDSLGQLVEPCLQQWFKVNGDYPRRIIMYRVGVGDGQLRTVEEYEIPQLRKIFDDLRTGYNPSLTYIVVQARNNTRYYTKRVNGDLNNPPPGTVLDHTVTKRDMTDFYLVSKSVRQGTVQPVHYVVVENSSDMSVENIESITFKLCHLYYNWSATVGVPAPCHYAQKLALQTGLRISAPTNEKMKNTLYFL